jgi:hypothetical protein
MHPTDDRGAVFWQCPAGITRLVSRQSHTALRPYAATGQSPGHREPAESYVNRHARKPLAWNDSVGVPNPSNARRHSAQADCEHS